jgi:UDP-glucose 6-dehydrogenase
LGFLTLVGLVIVTAALVLATYTYAEAARKQEEAMNRQAAAMTDPVVFFGVEDVRGVDQFFVQNVGPGIAYDVSFKAIKDFEAAVLAGPTPVLNQKLSDLAFLKNTIKAIAPGQKMPFVIIDPQKQKNLVKETIEVEVSYKLKSDAKEPFKQRFPIDFAYEQGMGQLTETIPDQLKKIAEGIAALKK